MITPKELSDKASKLFNKVVSADLKGDSLFPLVIPSNKRLSGISFSELKKDLVPLHQSSKAAKGKGYTVSWIERKISGSIQSIPGKIYFESMDDFLYFLRREGDYKKIESKRDQLITDFPSLSDWICDHPALLLEYYDEWSSIIQVCKYFVNVTPPHDYYIRELPIEVHTKFIEQHSDILRKLLDQLLPAESYRPTERDFSSRYFLKKPTVYTQIRILDDELKPHLGYDDVSVSLDDAAWLKWLPENIFIIENKICYLTFPKVRNSVAIFGEGFKSRLTKHIPWLKDTRLYCWFDMDAAGFEMLNMIKQHYPNASALLMDETTYKTFERFSVTNKNSKKHLPFLNQQEAEMYSFLVQNSIRLEQEKITQDYVMRYLKSMSKSKDAS